MKKYISITVAIALTTLLAGCGVKFGIESRNNWWNSNVTTDDSSNKSESVNISEDITKINKLDIKIAKRIIPKYCQSYFIPMSILNSKSLLIALGG